MAFTAKSKAIERTCKYEPFDQVISEGSALHDVIRSCWGKEITMIKYQFLMAYFEIV